MCKKFCIDDCHILAEFNEGQCKSTEYKDCDTNYEWQCNAFGHKWIMTYTSVKQGHWCPECNKIKRRLYYFGLCNKVAEEKGGFFLSTIYINARTKYDWMCGDCFYSWSASYDSVNRISWCPKCGGHLKLSIDACHIVADFRGGQCKSTEWKGTGEKYLWQCNCGYEWTATYSHVKDGEWCPKCSKNRLCIDDCHILAEFNGGQCDSNEYVGYLAKYSWWCGDCGNKWETTYSTVRQGCWCPKCAKSKNAKLLGHILEKLLNEKSISEYSRFLWQKIDSGGILRFDLYFPQSKSVFEYDGEQHFKPVCFGGISKKMAKERLKQTQRLDSLKNKLISEHQEDVKYFIRFNYTEPITEEYVKNKLIAAGIISAIN